jgi:hypothetical protein
MAIPGGMMDRAIQARKQQPGYNPNILGPFGNLITGVGNLLQGKPYGTSFTGVGNIPPSARGESYRRAELRLADAARPGGGGGGGGNAGYSLPYSSPAAERELIEQGKSRVSSVNCTRPRASALRSCTWCCQDSRGNATRYVTKACAIWAAKHGGLGCQGKAWICLAMMQSNFDWHPVSFLIGKTGPGI